MARSPGAYEKAAQLLDGTGQKMFDFYEGPLCARQAVGKRLPSGKETVYFIQPKAAHSTICGHLMLDGPFAAATDEWDSTHPEADKSYLERQGAKPALGDILSGSSPPTTWTVAREPLGHFIAGFDQVEFNFRDNALGLQTKCDQSDKLGQSQWIKSYRAGDGVTTRAKAMLSDMIHRTGPDFYVDHLVHVVPQTLGFRQSASEEPGQGFMQLNHVGKMEDLDSAWASVQAQMGITSPTQVNSHVNPQSNRRSETEGAIRREIDLALVQLDGEADRVAKRLANATALFAPVSPAPALQRWQHLASMTNSTFSEMAVLVSQQQQSRSAAVMNADPIFRQAFCLIMEREWSCLGYQKPKQC